MTKVKPLVWKGIVPISESIVGTYSIHRIGGEWMVRLSVHPHLHETQIASGKSPDFETALIDAKSAAQQDYEQRIMSALSTHPQPETCEPVGYVTKNELTKLSLGASCVDLFGKVVPKGFEMVPLYAHPHPRKGGEDDK